MDQRAAAIAEGDYELSTRAARTGRSTQHWVIEARQAGEVVGTATESLIRTLSEFKTDKLIDIQGGKITVLEETKLKKLIY